MASYESPHERPPAFDAGIRMQSVGDRAAGSGLAPWQIRRVCAHVDANLDATVRPRDLARIVRLSTSHFARAFKASFGVPPSTFIARRRIAQAERLMIATDERLCDIALACGFCDHAHFSRVFRRVAGVHPSVWRCQRRHAAGPTPAPRRPAIAGAVPGSGARNAAAF
jgi:transcriptional regulator GlxA family with amidase domain